MITIQVNPGGTYTMALQHRIPRELLEDGYTVGFEVRKGGNVERRDYEEFKEDDDKPHKHQGNKFAIHHPRTLRRIVKSVKFPKQSCKAGDEYTLTLELDPKAIGATTKTCTHVIRIG